jgi:hypothetical protein
MNVADSVKGSTCEFSYVLNKVKTGWHKNVKYMKKVLEVESKNKV